MCATTTNIDNLDSARRAVDEAANWMTAMADTKKVEGRALAEAKHALARALRLLGAGVELPPLADEPNTHRCPGCADDIPLDEPACGDCLAELEPVDMAAAVCAKAGHLYMVHADAENGCEERTCQRCGHTHTAWF